MKMKERVLWMVTLAVLLTGLVGCSSERRLERALARAEEQFKAGDYQRAEIEYLRVLQKDGRNARAVRGLAIIYQDQGRWKRAAPFLLGACRADTNDLALRVRFGQLFMAGGDIINATTEAVFVLNRAPTNSEALLLLAEVSLGTNEVKDARQRIQGWRAQVGDCAGFHLVESDFLVRARDLQGAETEIRKALTLDPNLVLAHLALGRVQRLQKKLPEAGQAFKAAFDLSGPRSLRKLPWIDFQLSQGKTEDMEKILLEMNRATPDFIPPLAYLAELNFERGKPEEAERWMQQTLARDPDNRQGRSLQGRLQMGRGKFDQAVETLERLVKDFPRAPELKYQLGLAYLLKGDLAKCVTALEQAIALAPNYDDAVMLLSQIKTRRGQAGAAEASAADLVQREPGNVKARYVLAETYRAQGKLKEAAALYRQLMEANPKDPQAPFQLGQVLLAQTNLAEARRMFESVLALDPDHLPSVEFLAGLDVGAKNPTAALQRAKALAEKKPEAPAPRLLLARLYLGQKETALAEAELQKIIKLAPDYSPAYALLVQLYSSTQRLPQAQEQLETMLARNPKDLGAHLRLAMILEVQKEYAKAKDHYEAVLKLNAKHSLALNNLAYLQAETLNNLDYAYELASQARELAPKDPYVADTYGWILCRRREYARAIPPLQEAVTALADRPEVLYHLGMAYYMGGQLTPARTTLEQAIKLGKTFPEQQDAQRRLAILNVDPTKASPDDIRLLESALQQDRADLAALGILGGVYAGQRAYQKQKEIYEAAYGVNPKAAPVLLSLAGLYSEQFKNPERALALAREARKLAPEDPMIARTLGRLTFAAGDHSFALSLLSEANGRQPGQPDLLHDLAMAYYSVGRVTDAENAMRAALLANATGDTAAAARQFLAMLPLHQQLGAPQEAQARAAAILKTEPGYVPAQMVAGLVSEQAKQWDAARKQFELVLGRYPQFTPAMKHLAMLCGEHLGDDAKAYDLGVKARETMRDDADLARMLGKLSYRRGDYKYAAQLLTESVRTFANDAELLFYLGLTQAKLKEDAKCKETLTRALALNPSHALAGEAKKVLGL